MEVDGGVRDLVVRKEQKAGQHSAKLMVGVEGVTTWGAPKVLKDVRVSALLMEVESDVAFMEVAIVLRGGNLAFASAMVVERGARLKTAPKVLRGLLVSALLMEVAVVANFQCTKGAQGSTKFCKAHGGGKRCTLLGCTKGAEGSTNFCKGLGGGKRCSFQGGGVCTKSVHGGTLYCVAHGGGKRCAVPECTKSARGRTDFYVRHGGGKRCKFEGCEKSAQGSTDFCKAHGGGKRCLWGQQGSGFGGDEDSPCDKFARGKIGLCAAHGALVQDMRVHGDGTIGLKMKEIASENHLGCPNNVGPFGPEAGPTVWNGFNLPMNLPNDFPLLGQSGEYSNAATFEGRVHGGGLMAMLGRL